MSKLESNWFRVAVAGPTADGRTIADEWLTDMAETYKPDVYTARIWPEHWRGLTPGGEFKAQGDVVALRTQVDTISGEQRLALYAKVAPLPSLVQMNQQREKVYASIEVTENFAGTGKAYLTGLAVTDSPASIGTEAITFAAQHFNARASDSIETVLTLEEPLADEKAPGLFSKALTAFKNRLVAFNTRSDKQLAEVMHAISSLLDQFEAAQTASDTQAEELGEQLEALEEKLSKQGKALAAMQEKYAKLDATDANLEQRPVATGGTGYALADC